MYVGERGVKNAEEVAFASTSASVAFAKNAKVFFFCILPRCVVRVSLPQTDTGIVCVCVCVRARA